MLTLIDEYTRECLDIVVDRKLRSTDFIESLAELFVTKGLPEHIRSDTARSSVRTRYGNGWIAWPSGRCSSSQQVRGRVATARASTASFEMSCSTARSSTPSRKPRS